MFLTMHRCHMLDNCIKNVEKIDNCIEPLNEDENDKWESFKNYECPTKQYYQNHHKTKILPHETCCSLHPKFIFSDS